MASARPDAENRGTAAADVSELDQNSYVADAFQAGRAACALYQQRSIDSLLYSALSMTVDGQATQLAFDCPDAMISGSVDGSVNEVLVCAAGS